MPLVFDRFLTSATPLLAEAFPVEVAATIVADARERYPQTKRDVPEIGGIRNVFTPVLVVNVRIIALHRAVLAQGGTAEDTIRVTQRVFDQWFRRLPGPVLRAEGRRLMSRRRDGSSSPEPARNSRSSRPAVSRCAVRSAPSSVSSDQLSVWTTSWRTSAITHPYALTTPG